MGFNILLTTIIYSYIYKNILKLIFLGIQGYATPAPENGHPCLSLDNHFIVVRLHGDFLNGCNTLSKWFDQLIFLRFCCCVTTAFNLIWSITISFNVPYNSTSKILLFPWSYIIATPLTASTEENTRYFNNYL